MSSKTSNQPSGRAARRDAKRRKRMKVTGKSVFALAKLISRSKH